VTRPRLIAAWVLVAVALVDAAGAQDSRVESRPTTAPSRLFHPSARWIWDAAAPPVDAYRVFRKTFTLPHEPPSPSRRRLRITADSEYRLYVNGQYVGRGPAPSPPGRASVDEYSELLRFRQGVNAIAVVVHHLGTPSFARPQGRGGLIAELEVSESLVVTDASWRVSEGWWLPTNERFTPMREFTEHLDGRKQPGRRPNPDVRNTDEPWAMPDLDDSSWGTAAEIGPEGTAPWNVLELRDIPMPSARTVFPTAVLFTGACASAVPPKADAAKALATMPEEPASVDRILNSERLLGPTYPGALLNAFEDGLVIGLDFGRVVSGFPWVEASASDGTVLDLGYGEGLDAQGRVTVFKQNYPASDRITLGSHEQRLEIFHHRAFRYLVVSVRGGSAAIRRIGVIESGYPVVRHGSFACSDPDLVRIWEAGRETTRLCMDQGFMDCPWRERGQYIGDAIVEAPAALYAFGDTRLARRFLHQAAFCQPADGLLEPAYPCDWTAWHGNRGPNRIPGYGALWVVLLEEHWRATRDYELVWSLAPVLDKQLAWFDSFRTNGGLLEKVPEWNFIDWAQLDNRTERACLNLQYLMALKSAVALDWVLGRKPGRVEQAKAFAAEFHRVHWDEAKGVYRDGEGLHSAHTNALALLSLVDDPVIANRVLAGMVSTVRPGSPYFDGYVLRALARWGRHDAALAVIRERWLPMLTNGPGTLWEMYAKDASLCHGWSSAPTTFLQREIAGISFEALSMTVRFAPRPAGLSWMNATASFWCGDVRMSWKAAQGGGFVTWISTPPTPRIEVDLEVGRETVAVVDGATVDAKVEGGFLRLLLPGGPHTIEVKPR
jgi:alpha-L-rhamnosidase